MRAAEHAAAPEARDLRGGRAINTTSDDVSMVAPPARMWVARLTPEERLERYGDPADRYCVPCPFGLTLDGLRAEWRRRAADGWQRWELAARFTPRGAA